MKRRRLLGFGAALLLGAAIGVSLWPTIEREWMLRRLFSEEAEERFHAAQWWGASEGGGGPPRVVRRSAHSQRIVTRLEMTMEQATFVDVAAMLQQAGLWRLPLIPTTLWRRRLDLILDSQDSEAARSVLDELGAAEVPRDDANAGELWGRLLAWPHDASIRLRTLRQAAGWFEADEVEAHAAAAREDDDAQVRRLAWLLLGHLSPASGYAAVWRGEEPRVVEAMLWAATVTNPLDASPLLMACDQSPWPTSALPWLMSRSHDEAARQRLESLAVDGNRAAALHLAERWDAGLESLAPEPRAWLGGKMQEADPIPFARWSAWRRGEGDVDRLLADPVAKDGSVWAAVLLAERLLDDTARAELAQEWLRAAETGTRCAGALLYALSTGDGWRLAEAYAESQDPTFRRAARLARLVADAGAASSEASATNRAYAWTVVKTQPDERLAALMTLLAVGDERAAESILSPPVDSPAGAAMLERAWLIERFLPGYAAVVAPLCPWSDEVAALQFDIMAAAWALRGGVAAFDPDSRTFRYTVDATALPR